MSYRIIPAAKDVSYAALVIHGIGTDNKKSMFRLDY
jgi:hypothetical protein